jgi:acetyltransferase
MSESAVYAIMNPSSIAIVGASNNLFKMGTIQCLNLINSGFPGEIFPVHPTEDLVLGKKAYHSVKDLPIVPDLVLMVLPARLVSEFLEEFGRLGTKYAVIITAGFRETGEEGRDLEKKIITIADRYGLRFLGPNCLGIINTQLPLNTTVMPVQDLNGKLGIVSQSGTYVTQNLSYLHRHGITISKAISVGNGANIDIVDCLEYLGEDESTTAIALYIEGIHRAGQFLNAARAISARKPIIAQYVGGTEAGARAGSSHTGAMAGPDCIYQGLFEQAGIIRVDTIEEVMRIGWTLASQPPLKGSRIAVVTNSGGPGTSIAHTCNKGGLDVPELSIGLQEKIGGFIAGHASPRNPVDITYHIDMTALVEKIPQMLFESDEIDGIVIHGIMDTGFFSKIYPMVSKLLDIPEVSELPNTDLSKLIKMPFTYGKPLIVSSFFDDEDHCVREFRNKGIPLFDAPEKAAGAMVALHKHFLIRKRAFDEITVSDTPDGAKEVISESGDRAIDEFDAKRILRSYGIPTTREYRVYSWQDIRNGAQDIGYPVVVKVCSSKIMHKTEQGMVMLDITDEAGLKRAYDEIRCRDEESALLVSEMLKGDREFMAGVSSFPGFPPCVMFGLGGIFTEALKDTVIRLAPLSRYDAISMMEALSSRALLGSYRGMMPVDREALASVLMALGNVAIDIPQIREIDLNPIIIVNGKPTVADALFIKR